MKFPLSLLFFPVLIAGCTQNQSVAEAPSATDNQSAQGETAPEAQPVVDKSSPATPGSITRQEVVPNGVETPSGLTVPRGFKVQLLADDFEVPRRLAIAPGGKPNQYDLFVAESRANRVTALRVQNGKVAQRSTFTERTRQPYGIAFWKNWAYVANTDSVVRFPYKAGSLKAGGAPQQITKLTEGGYNQHWTRNLLFAEDNSKLYVTVGSSCNTCEESDSQRAAVSVMNPDGTGRRLFATGLRNPVGLAWRPGTKELWTAVNERDRLGDDIPPDYITHVVDGAFYGWPYAYVDLQKRVHPDPEFGKKRPDLVKRTRAWDVPVQAHSAALGIAFYPAAGGKFPANYSGDAFLTFHGSWNRSEKTGYKVVRVDFQNGKPISVTDFVRGFQSGEPSGGRPVDVQVAPDGSIVFSDDGRGRIWRVSYGG